MNGVSLEQIHSALRTKGYSDEEIDRSLQKLVVSGLISKNRNNECDSRNKNGYKRNIITVFCNRKGFFITLFRFFSK